MHEPGTYLRDKSLLPAEYGNTKRKWSDHFSTLCVWLVLVAMALFILTWSCPNSTKKLSSKINTEKVKGVRKNG